jgi:hypothetical protein
LPASLARRKNAHGSHMGPYLSAYWTNIHVQLYTENIPLIGTLCTCPIRSVDGWIDDRAKIIGKG